MLVRAWVLVRMLERVRERGCGLVAVVHAWAVSCTGERGTSTSWERVAERERELEAQVLGARCGARNARAVVGGVRVRWWVLVRVVARDAETRVLRCVLWIFFDYSVKN